MFCCESGTHVVDPGQSYYAGLAYRAGTKYYNATAGDAQPQRKSEDKCLDSTQAWFCRDLWVWKAKEGMKEVDQDMDIQETPRPSGREDDNDTAQIKGRGPEPQEDVNAREAQHEPDADANAGSDYDATDLPLADPPPATAQRLTAPNSVFLPVRIMVNPRCVTTYAGVSHTQLALDLFGPPDREDREDQLKKEDILQDWEGAPDTFVCQEQQ